LFINSRLVYYIGILKYSLFYNIFQNQT